MSILVQSQGELSRMTKLHKGFYLGSWTAGGIIIIIMLVSSWIALLKGNQDLAEDLYIYALIPYIYTGIVWLAILYQSWAAIQDGQASVTPVKAVVYMLIPFFRYYWIFRAFRNYAESSTPISPGTVLQSLTYPMVFSWLSPSYGLPMEYFKALLKEQACRYYWWGLTLSLEPWPLIPCATV